MASDSSPTALTEESCSFPDNPRLDCERTGSPFASPLITATRSSVSLGSVELGRSGLLLLIPGIHSWNWLCVRACVHVCARMCTRVHTYTHTSVRMLLIDGLNCLFSLMVIFGLDCLSELFWKQRSLNYC